MSSRWPLIVGALGLIGWVIGMILAPHDALAAWLVTWLAWGSIPIGALALLMLVALIPGNWRKLYVHPLSIGATLTPLVLIAAIPLLIGLDLLFPWTQGEAAATLSGFKGLWLSSSFFILRNILFLLILSALAWGLVRASAEARSVIASVGILAYAIIGSLIGIDFAESTEPMFHSSIYGLLALTNQWLAGVSFAIILGLWRSDDPPPLAAAGVLVTAILLWAYMHAMQYVVIWAADIPAEVRWYLERGQGAWGLVAAILFGIQGLLSFAALLLPSVRNSRQSMVVLAAGTLVMRLVENAWMVLPGLDGLSLAVAPLIVAASAAMLGIAGFVSANLGWAGKWNEHGWASEVRSA